MDMLELRLKEIVIVIKTLNYIILILIFIHIIATRVPISTIPTDQILFPTPKSDKPDSEYLKSHFFQEGRLTESQVLRIVKAGTKLLKTEPNLLDLDTPATSTFYIIFNNN